MSGGGVFLPSDPPPSTGQVLTSPTLTGTVLMSGSTISGATFTGATLATPTVTAGTLSGVTITGSTISGATVTGVTTGTLSVSGAQTLFPVILTTATGATGTDAAAISAAIAPAWLVVTGTSGMGIALPTGPAGLVYFVTDMTTGIINVYCSGGTFDGVTGTTAVALTVTGNRGAVFACSTATGAWIRAIRST
jgi:hypothetical protein